MFSTPQLNSRSRLSRDLFDESPTQLIGETLTPVRTGRDNIGASTANTGETAPPTPSSSLMPFGPGVRSRSPTLRCDRLRRLHADSRRWVYPRSLEDQVRARQHVKLGTGCALQYPASRGSKAHPAPDRVPLCNEACQLAQHGRDRDWLSAAAASRRRISDQETLEAENLA